MLLVITMQQKGFVGFPERDAGHAEHLADVEAALAARGFTTTRTGREVQEPPRTLLGKLADWWPDLLARRGPYGKFFVDAKNDESPDTENYSIELAALASYGLLVSHYRIQVVLVWPGGKCNYAMDLRAELVSTRANRGSGTAYLLVKESDQRSFDAVFGTVDEGRSYLARLNQERQDGLLLTGNGSP